MPLQKPKKDLRIAILVPCYKRPDYTNYCLGSIVQAQEYPGGISFEKDNNVTRTIIFTPDCNSLRSVIIDFFNKTKYFDFICKVDNDCMVPKNWLNDILNIFDKHDVDILSPNVSPSNAAMKHGEFVEGLPYRPAKVIGGLWFMKRSMVDDMVFYNHDVVGITGAIAILRQIYSEKSPIMGWVPSVVFDDMGHWSGEHPMHIKSKDHLEYSNEVGREIAWTA